MSSTDDRIQVMVVDDSTVTRGVLSRIIEAEDDLCVAASAPNGRAALDLLRHRPVDVVLLDIEMPEMDGLTALPLMLEMKPHLRVIMVSTLTQRGAEVTLRAMHMGAADYLSKSLTLSMMDGMNSLSVDLVRKVRALGRSRRGALEPVTRPVPVAPSPPHAGHGVPTVVAIAASTGGPNALSAVLRGLPADFPVPIVVVQHMPAVFTSTLADRITRETGRACTEARPGEPVVAGHTYLAPGDYHLTVVAAQGRQVLHLDQGSPVHYCRPAADPMLSSVSRLYGPGVLAVVLTGMGEDGLAGCREVVSRGGRVLAQDEATSVVWGMPGAVVRAGLASAVLPVGRIAGQILQHCAVST